MASPSIKNYLILFLALTTLVGGALALSQYQKIIKLRGEALSDSARADLEKRLQDLQKSKNKLAAEIASLRARRNSPTAGDAAAAPAAAAAQEPAGGPARFGRQNRANVLSTLMENPEFNKLWTEQQKARISSAFGPLCKSLNLTPAQTAQFQSLLAERQMTMMDALSAARAEGVMGRDEIGSVLQQATSQVDSQIQALLGPDGYSQYQNFVQTQPQRIQVNELQIALVTAGNPPLQDYQVQQLTQILAQNSTAGADGGPRPGGAATVEFGGMGRPSVSGPFITQEAVNQAASVLTPTQVQALQQMQQQQAAQRQIFSIMRQSSGGPPASGQAGAAAKTTGGSVPPPPGPPEG